MDLNAKRSINEQHLNGIAMCLYPSICGYLLNYPFVYFTDDATAHCLNAHKLTLHSIQYKGDTLIQFSVPQKVVDTVDDNVVSKYCDRLCSVRLSVQRQPLKHFVAL